MGTCKANRDGGLQYLQCLHFAHCVGMFQIRIKSKWRVIYIAAVQG